MIGLLRGSFRKISKGGQKHIGRHFGGGGGGGVCVYSEQYLILKG